MIRRHSSLALIVVSVAVVASSAWAVDLPPDAAPPVPDHTDMVSVLPPGQNGLATLDPLTQEVVFGPHFLDQLDMYADLVFEDEIVASQVSDFFKDAGFNTVADPANVERVEVVTPAVKVFRDLEGVPHVYGVTDGDVAYGAGYVTAEDRMFEADLFRRAGRGTLAELLGPDFIEADKVTRRDGYTEAELQQQLDLLPVRFGANGARIKRVLEAFTAGFNQRVAEVLANPTLLPVEYVGTGNLPQPWRATDTVAESVLLSRTFGEAAGAEVRNAALYKGLIATFGAAEGKKAFNDLRWLNDPASPTTVPPGDGAFTYPDTGPVDPAAVALPDNADDVYQGQLDEIATLSEVLGDIGMAAFAQGQAASNAILVGAGESGSGNSLQLGDPQVNYSVPQYLMEIHLHGGGYRAAGMTFPGVSSVVLIGHGEDYAWTVTSGISDAVDVRVERLCNPAGGPVEPDSSFYLFDGQCRPMETRTETVVAKNSAPPVIDPDAPEADAAVIKVQRTQHGPVFARDTVEGAPVALVKERAFWMRELDNAAAFGSLNFNDLIRNVNDFSDAVKHNVVSLNMYYADRDTVGYFHSGRYPIRREGVDTRLPTWGTGQWEWQGMLPWSRQPHYISRRTDPASRDYTSNWNNKPATGWANGDDTNYGEIHRVDALINQLDPRLSGSGTMDPTDVINVMNAAATVDPRAAKLFPLLSGLTDAGADARLTHALDVLGDWVADEQLPGAGAHRRDADDDGFYDRGNAVRLWDRWNENLVENIFFDEIDALRPYLGIGVVDAPGPGGSAFFDGLFNHVLHVLDDTPSLAPQRNWLGSQSKTGAVTEALIESLDELGVASDGDLDALQMPREEIVFESFGASAPLEIHWVNRGTWTHVAEITGRR